MARIRTIKPEFFRHEALQDLEIANPGMCPLMVFAGLWGHCDSKGRFEWKPRMLKLDILPFLPFDMEKTLEILEQAGMLRRYSVNGKDYGEVPTFEKHQRLSGKELTDGEKFPSPTQELTVKHSGSAGEIPESQEGKGREEEGKGLEPPVLSLSADDQVCSDESKAKAEQALSCPATEIVALYHAAMPNNPRCKVLNDARKRAIRQRWKEAATLSDKPFGYSTRAAGMAAWKAFFEVCAESPFLTGRAPARPGVPPFVADIDFLMTPAGFAKCFENKYHREAA